VDQSRNFCEVDQSRN